MEWWRADRIWDGATVVIVAGGESVTAAQIRLIGMARERDYIRAIAINDAVYLCWWADFVWACDAKWWRYHGPLKRFPGQRLTLEKPEYDGIGRLRNTGKEGFDQDRTAVRTGGNGGYQAIHLAVHLGAKRIILVGYDMNGDHWFGPHPALIRGTPPRTSVLIPRLTDLAVILKDMGVAVVNASHRSELKCFPMVDLATELTALEKT